MNTGFFIFGLGYTARVLAHQLSLRHIPVIGTSKYHDSGLMSIDFNDPNLERYFQTATHVLISTPPSQTIGDPVLAQFKPLLKQYAHQIQWIGYLSSTSVYGDHQGAWVDESSSGFDLGDQARLRLDAENAWLAIAAEYQLPLHIFRISGIYGPGRNALLRLAQGKTQSIYKPGQFFSRIHVDDIATVLLASIQKPNPVSIYNVADNEPAASSDVDTFAALLLSIPPPVQVPFEDAILSPMAREFYLHNRRVNNDKIKRELGVVLNYPSYRKGLTQLYEQEFRTWQKKY